MTAEPTGFLYPFIEGDERDVRRLLADLAASAGAKMAESAALRAGTLDGAPTTLRAAGDGDGPRFRRGGRLFTFGNGGSATDAEARPRCSDIRRAGRALPAHVARRRPGRAHRARPTTSASTWSSPARSSPTPGRGDIAIGFSTSGDSVNVLRRVRRGHAPRAADGRAVRATKAARWRRSTTSTTASSCASDSVHRIQEAQAALVLELWSVVQRRRLERGARS